MTTKPLHIAPNISLPLDAVTETLAWLGNRGSGKTHGAKVMAEEMLKAGAQVAVLDPVDAWYGLRFGRERGKSGLPIYVFGGSHGDAPLESTAGALLANVIVEQGISAVFSMRHLPKAQQRRFAKDFAEQLYLRKGEDQYRSALHVFIEEAHTFAPQTQGRGEDLGCLGAIQDLVLQGRGSGIGVSLITQRVATLAKAVLELAEVLFAFRTTGPNARDALKKWFAAQDGDDHLNEFLAAITGLQRGQCWLWSPGYLGLFEHAAIRQAETFDSSATPKPGHARANPAGKAAALDLEELGTAITATVERAKADDPRTLRSRIAELEKELAKRPTEQVERIVEVPTVPERARKLAASIASRVQGIGLDIEEQLGKVTAELEQLIADGSPTAHFPPSFEAPKRATPQVTAPQRKHESQVDPAAEIKLKAGARRMLHELGSWPNGLTPAQLSTRARVKRTGGSWSTYLSALRVSGLIQEGGLGYIITQAGLDYIGQSAPMALSPDELLADWRKRLKAGCRRMLDILIEAYPNAVNREELSERSEVSTAGGSWSTYLSILRTNDLMVETDRGFYRASEVFFA